MAITVSKYIKNSKEGTKYIGFYHYTSYARGTESATQMYGLLSVSSDIKIPGNKITKFAWDGMVDGFEYSKTDSINESVKLSLTEAARRIKQLITNDKEIGEHGVNVDFSLFVANHSGGYIGLFGESDIFVYKEGKVVDISEMLSKKSAKTAGVLLGEGDIVFLSTKDFLKTNLTKIALSKTNEQLISTLDDLGKEIGDNEALIVFLNQTEEREKPVEVVKKVQKRERRRRKSVPVEPTDSDYIPTSKEVKKVFKSPDEGRDLKSYLSTMWLKISPFLKTLKTKLLPVKEYFKNICAKAGSSVKRGYIRMKESVTEKVGRERWFKKMLAKISQSSIGRKKERGFKAIKIDGYKDRSKRFQRIKILLAVLLGIVLLLSGIKFTMDKRDARIRSREANEVFIQVDELLSQAQDVLTRDSDSAQVLVYKASEQLAQLPEELSVKDKEKYNELMDTVSKINDTLFKRTRLFRSDGSIQPYFETVVEFGKDSKPTDIGIYRDQNAKESLLVVDTGTKAVFSISLYDKKYMAIPDENKVLQDPKYVYSKESGIYVMDTSSGVVKAEFEGNWFKSFTTLSGLSIQNISAQDITEFAVLTANENVYVLDRKQKSLLRATKYGSGYGLASQYLTKEEYDNANDVLADLSVYILTPGEFGLHRYVHSSAQGKMVESPITIVGLDKPLGNARYGFTREDMNKSLYIFDSEHKRILRFEKPLESGDLRHPNEYHLLRQYVFEEDSGAWNNVKDFVVDFDEEYLYLLDGTTIWKVRL